MGATPEDAKLMIASCFTGLIATVPMPAPSDAFPEPVLDALAPTLASVYGEPPLAGWGAALTGQIVDDPKHHAAVYLYGLAAHLSRSKTHTASDAFVGHSLGAYAALVASGALTARTALELCLAAAEATERAQADHALSIAAVTGVSEGVLMEIADTLDLGSEIRLTHRNTPLQCLVSGRRTTLTRLCAEAEKNGAIQSRLLSLPGVIHTPALAPEMETFRQILGSASVERPHTPVYSCVTARRITTRAEVRDYVTSQACCPVRFDETVEIMASDRIRDFVVLGSGAQLAKVISLLAPDASIETFPKPLVEGRA